MKFYNPDGKRFIEIGFWSFFKAYLISHLITLVGAYAIGFLIGMFLLA